MQKIRNKILLVEDSKELQQLIKKLLEPIKDMEIIVAQNGVEALMAIKKFSESIKLVLLDIIMPTMDGYRLLLRLNKIYLERPFKVCMLTALDNDSSIKKALQLKVDNYIIKPIDRPIFMKTICSLLKNFDGDNEKFATKDNMSLNTYLLDHPEYMSVSINIFELSEFHIAFKTKFKLERNSEVKFNLYNIGIDCEFTCKIMHVKDIGTDNHEYIGQFIGLIENKRKLIRSYTIRSADL